MAHREGPAGEVHFDIERINLIGHEIFRLGSRIALSAIESGACDLGDGAIRGDIRETGEPVG